MTCLLCILCLLAFALSSCSSSDNGSGQTGSLSLSLQFPQSAITADSTKQFKAISDRCSEFGISALDAKVYDENNVLLFPVGSWSCEAGEGTLRVRPGSNRSVRVNLNNDEGRIILTGRKSNLTVIAGKVTEAVIDIDYLNSEEILLDALNDNATVNHGGTVTVLDSGYASLLQNDLAPDMQSLYVNTAPISGPSHGSLALYEDGTFSYTHNGGKETSDSFTYEAKDAHGGTDIATVNIAISSEANHVPVLGSAKLSPETGGTDTSFTFSIRYTDQDGQSPLARYLYIDGKPYRMALDAGQNAWDGTYTYSTKLSAGSHKYYYSFSDGHGGSARLPASGTSSGMEVVGQVNRNPVLDNGGVSPGQGATGTPFTYSVHYSDPDSDPADIRLVYIDGAPYTMNLSSGDAWNGTYTYSTTLSAEKHSYYFSFSDGKDGLAQLPANGTSSGPSVSSSPNPVNQIPVIDGQGVSPVEGSTSTTYTYSVHYSDPDGDIPTSRIVYIDGTAHDMALKSGTASNGIYTFSTTLAPGAHNYYLLFSDGKAPARLPLMDTYAGPFVNHSPVLTNASVNPPSGTSAQIFTYSIYYSDQDGHAPVTKSIYIDGTAHDMSFASGVSQSNGTYTFRTSLGPGSHTFYFLFSDGHEGGLVRQPSSGSLSGPGVSNPLSNATLSPAEGTAATTFTFSINYHDPAGNAPSTAAVFIDGTSRPMALSSGSASNGSYTYQGRLSPGTHSYYFHFTCASGGNCRYPVSGTLPGPVVNHPPALKSGSVSPEEGTTVTTFTYSVHYTDQDDDTPLNAAVFIDGSEHAMSLSSGSASDGIYVFSTTLPCAPHTYYFEFTDEHGDGARLPASGTSQGPSVAPANVVYVDQVNGQSGNSGRSWALSLPSIHEAIEAANLGDQIWVKKGVYLLAQPIAISKDLELYGGFSGSEHYLSQRDFSNNTVYIDGQGLTRCFNLSGSAGRVVVDGFCIQNGYSSSGGGAGILNTLPASLSVFNCTFRSNSAVQGGGICNSNSTSNLAVVNCLFEDNVASTSFAGGGVYSLAANTEISTSVFRYNTARDGGGIGCSGPRIFISNSLLYNNTAYTPSYGNRGGGIAIWNSGNAAITNCTIYANQASYKGGAVFCENSTLAVWNSIVRSNSFGVYNKQIFGLSSTVTVQFSDVELGDGEQPWGLSCIDDDPDFADGDAGNFRLTSGSPCIDKASNEAPYILDRDLDGNTRIMGSAVDMGTYEFSY